VEKSGERRRRFYRLTAGGEQALAVQRRSWTSFFTAIDRVARLRRA
jgi:DNA-binding PadR family transcriptional regulator